MTGWSAWSGNAGRSGCRLVDRREHRDGTLEHRLGPGDLRQAWSAARWPKSKRCSTTQPDGCPTDLLEKQTVSCVPTRCWRLLDGKGGAIGATGDRRRRGPHQPSSRRATVTRLGCRRRPPARGTRRHCDPTANVYTITVRNGVVIDAPRPAGPGSWHAVGEPGPTTGLHGLVRDVCGAGCCVRYSRHQVASHHLVATRRTNRPGESVAVVRDPPPEGPPRRLAHRARSEPRTDYHPAGRTSHDDRPTPSEARHERTGRIEVTRATGTLARMPWGDDSADARLHGTSIADSVLDLDRQHAAGPAEAHQRDPRDQMRAGDEDGDHQPGWVVEGPAGAGDDHRRRTRRVVEARRHHRRADERQHRCRPGHRRGATRVQVRVRDDRQERSREDHAAARPTARR